MAETRAENYTLKDERGNWLGQVVLTDDGMFASVTDYGNFSFAWRAFGDNFREFLLSIRPDYFACKMHQGMAYVLSDKKVERAAKRFADKILPALQQALKEEKMRVALNNPEALAKVGEAMGDAVREAVCADRKKPLSPIPLSVQPEAREEPGL